MTKSDAQTFCRDICDLMDFYEKVTPERKSGVQKLLSEVLSYAHPDISIDASIEMRRRGNNSRAFPGYFISDTIKNENKKGGMDKTFRGKVQITDEHIIPKKVVINHLFFLKKEKRLSDEAILFCTKLLSYTCLVTAEENRKLSKYKLVTTMPDGWSFPCDIDYDKVPDLKALDFFARYKKAGINYCENVKDERLKVVGADENKKKNGGYTGFYK
ncbi:hypothetical protein [uncultured Treponema sp.]|uniref:hypothetical protein n=1 Tax=uncultured Treponema sp. TaxID=162155 RepID=UPI0025EB671A|nr:hypothetical protein [uncultured Treponema sp.]